MDFLLAVVTASIEMLIDEVGLVALQSVQRVGLQQINGLIVQNLRAKDSLAAD